MVSWTNDFKRLGEKKTVDIAMVIKLVQNDNTE